MRSPGYTTVIQWLSEIWCDFDTNIIIKSFDQCGITSQSNLHSALRAVVEENKTFSNFVDDFYEADEIHGFTNDGLELDDDDMQILMAENDEIPSSQIPPPLPTTTPPPSSSSSPSTTVTSTTLTATSNTTATSSATKTNASNVTATLTPTLNQIQQQIQQHELLKQLQIVNKPVYLIMLQAFRHKCNKHSGNSDANNTK